MSTAQSKTKKSFFDIISPKTIHRCQDIEDVFLTEELPHPDMEREISLEEMRHDWANEEYAT